jgi:epoxyqueuosine reductase
MRGMLAREFLAMSQPEFSARFKGSAMKRAKRRRLARNAPVLRGNIGTSGAVPLLEAALRHDEPLVREHAACALHRIMARSNTRHRRPATRCIHHRSTGRRRGLPPPPFRPQACW